MELIDDLAPAGTRRDGRHARHGADARLGPGAVPERAPGRLRAPGSRAHAGGLERTYGGSIVVLPSETGRPRPECCPRTITRTRTDVPLAADVVDLLLDPWRSGITSRALIEILLHRRRRRPARVLGRALRPVVRRRVARPRDAPRARDRRAGRVPAHARRRARSRDRRAGGRPGRPAARRSAPTPAIAVVVTSLVGLGALLALAPDSPAGVQRAAVRRRARRVERRAAADGGARGWSCWRRCELAHGQLLTVGFDRTNAPAFGASPQAADTLLLLLVGAFTIVAVQALGNLLVLAMLVGPAATARLVTHRLRTMMALAAADRRRRRRRRALPLLLRGHGGRRVDRRACVVAVHVAAVAGLRLSKTRLKAGPVAGLEPAA